MSISYNLGIPASGNNPSQDQPNMQNNNDNIGSYVSVDHIGFTSSGDTGISGHHKQVTFDNNYVPAVPTSPPVLFTNTVQGLPQLFFYSGDAAHSSTQYVDSANGSTFVLGGIIMKWGAVNATDNNTIGFPVVFPNHCYNVQITVNDATTPLPTLVTVSGSPIPGGFTPRVKDTNGMTANPVSIFYLAIGD